MSRTPELGGVNEVGERMLTGGIEKEETRSPGLNQVMKLGVRILPELKIECAIDEAIQARLG
jgi:hypothetical protein